MRLSCSNCSGSKKTECGSSLRSMAGDGAGVEGLFGVDGVGRILGGDGVGADDAAQLLVEIVLRGEKRGRT